MQSHLLWQLEQFSFGRGCAVLLAQTHFVRRADRLILSFANRAGASTSASKLADGSQCLRPGGALECSHGWSIARAKPGDAEPVDGSADMRAAPAGAGELLADRVRSRVRLPPTLRGGGRIDRHVPRAPLRSARGHIPLPRWGIEASSVDVPIRLWVAHRRLTEALSYLRCVNPLQPRHGIH